MDSKQIAENIYNKMLQVMLEPIAKKLYRSLQEKITVDNIVKLLIDFCHNNTTNVCILHSDFFYWIKEEQQAFTDENTPTKKHFDKMLIQTIKKYYTDYDDDTHYEVCGNFEFYEELIFSIGDIVKRKGDFIDSFMKELN